MVRAQNDDHLDELGCVLGQAPLEPQQADDVTDAHVAGHHVADLAPVVCGLLTAIVADGAGDARGAAHAALSKGGCKVDGHDGGGHLRGGHNDALGNELLVGRLDDGGQALKGRRHKRARLAQRCVLGGGAFRVAATLGASVPKLHLRGKDGSARAGHPRHQRLCDLAFLHGGGNVQLRPAAQLAQDDNHLDLGYALKAQHVVKECGAGEHVATNGDALKQAVRLL
mmetsp:Transcript_2972/g.7254  ORF Transcript_2972/g.7254 Transcript_2972/m.7254 type:complete len:226 (+) Transcript_2972:759-1436(+)